MLAVLAGATLTSVTPTYGGQPAYVGKWGKDAAHCKFTSSKKSGNSFPVPTISSVEGDQQTGSLKLAIKGKSLIVDGSHKLKRCG